MSFTSIIGTALSGLSAAAKRLAVSAHNTANANTDGFTPRRAADVERPGGGVDSVVLSRGGEGSVDFAEEAVEQIVAERAYQANAAVLRTARDLESELLDRRG